MKEVFQNELGQAIGKLLKDWKPCQIPAKSAISGKYTRLEVLDSTKHAEDLHNAFQLDTEGKLWTYLPYGPFATVEAFSTWVDSMTSGKDPIFYAVVDMKTSKAIGVVSYLNIVADVGTIEVGHLNYSPLMQKTIIATEAMYLLMKRAFDELGYRRYEWKCDALNAGSRGAALRLGFEFEGIFRQASVYKGRNRDTAWFSIIDTEWPLLKKAFEVWLAVDNFDANGRQIKKLTELIIKYKDAEKV